MKLKSDENKSDHIDQNVIIQMITFSIIIIVVVLTLASFIRIYSNKKGEILKEMQIEAELLEAVVTDHLNYSRYFIDIAGRNILHDRQNLEYIHNLLKDYFTSTDFNRIFGWRKYSWVNEDFNEVVSSTEGIIQKPKHVPYVKNILEYRKANNFNLKDNIVFHTKISSAKGNRLKIIDNLHDPATKKYLGSMVLSFDVDTMIKGLNIRKKNKSTNFVILDQNMVVVAQSKEVIDHIINKDEELDSRLNKVIEELRAKDNKSRDVSYLDMINGLNYFVSPLNGFPFTIIVNIDNNVIKQDIIDNIARQFIEVCIFAIVCLFMVITIYRRETRLRAKAEKATAVAKNATKTRTDFLAYTAHEIRSPLGFIKTGSEIMIQELWGNLSPKYKKYARGIYQNSNLILDFINDILDENQIIEGRFKIVNALADVSKIIDESIKVNLVRFNTRNVNIKVDLDRNLPSLICDRRRILQVMTNLISNAIKYSDDGTTTFVSASVVNGQMEITVMDQGIGMKEEDIPIALSPYGTLRSIDYQSTGSYGLGLAIVRMLLDAHDATLSISSVEKKGTTIKVTFPKYKLVYNARNKNVLKKK